MAWIRARGLTLVLLTMFALSLAGQVGAGHVAYNADRAEVGLEPAGLQRYLRTGHLWEAVFENWESEFLQMAVFVLLTTVLVQQGSPESRRPQRSNSSTRIRATSLTHPACPGPCAAAVGCCGYTSRRSALTFILLFVGAFAGHAAGGHAAAVEEALAHGTTPPRLAVSLTSSRFWFESLQNWQSEFLAIASMVWLAVYLRQRRSPESKPVHAPCAETGR